MAIAVIKRFVMNPAQAVGFIGGMEVDPDYLLFAIRPDGSRRSFATTEIPTDHLRDLVSVVLARFNSVLQTEFFDVISRRPWGKSLAGRIFENFLHARIRAFPINPALIAVSNSTEKRISIPVCKTIVLLNLTHLQQANRYPVPFYFLPPTDNYT